MTVAMMEVDVDFGLRGVWQVERSSGSMRTIVCRRCRGRDGALRYRTRRDDRGGCMIVNRSVMASVEYRETSVSVVVATVVESRDGQILWRESFKGCLSLSVQSLDL